MNRPLRVLTIGHSYVVAMNRALVREVAKDSGFAVTVVAPAFFHGDLRPMAIESEPPGSPLRVEALNAHLTKSIHLFRYDGNALSRLLNTGGFDVVHAWEEPYIYAGYQIAQALRSAGARFCFRTAQSHVKSYPPPFGFFERRVLNRAQGWIAGASLVHQAMIRRRYPPQLGRILNLAVDLSAFQVLTQHERAQVLGELGLKPPVLGFLGRLTAAKGVDVLTAALDRLLTRSWSLLILGSGERKAHLERWVAQRGLQRRVAIRLANHDEVPRYLGAMDLLAAPSQTMKNWREQFGRMIIEAFACGVPVIASDSGEIPYVVGDAGRIIPEKNVAAWADGIAALLDDPGARARMAAAGLERAQQFSVGSTAEAYRAYYRWLASQPIN